MKEKDNGGFGCFYCCLLGGLFGFICAKFNLIILLISVIILLIALAIVVWKI